jgi:hypothetical protein
MRFRRKKTLDRIAQAFADSVEAFDFDAAEGWFATARLHVGQPARPTARGPERGQPAPRRARRSA